MAARQVRRLPVVEGENLVGVLAQADVAREAQSTATGAMVEEISESADSPEHYVQSPCPASVSGDPSSDDLPAE